MVECDNFVGTFALKVGFMVLCPWWLLTPNCLWVSVTVCVTMDGIVCESNVSAANDSGLFERFGTLYWCDGMSNNAFVAVLPPPVVVVVDVEGVALGKNEVIVPSTPLCENEGNEGVAGAVVDDPWFKKLGINDDKVDKPPLGVVGVDPDVVEPEVDGVWLLKFGIKDVKIAGACDIPGIAEKPGIEGKDAVTDGCISSCETNWFELGVVLDGKNCDTDWLATFGTKEVRKDTPDDAIGGIVGALENPGIENDGNEGVPDGCISSCAIVGCGVDVWLDGKNCDDWLMTFGIIDEIVDGPVNWNDDGTDGNPVKVGREEINDGVVGPVETLGDTDGETSS